MRNWISIAMLAAAAVAVSACKPGADGGPVVARVGSKVVTAAEFEHEMERRSPGRPLYFKSVDNRRKLLEDLARHHMLVQEAHAAGIADDPEFGALVERMLIQRLRETRLAEKLDADSPDDDAVADYYRANVNDFTRPARRQVAMIRVDVPRRADDDERAGFMARATEAAEAAAALPADTLHFGAVAVEYSDDRSSRYQGGVVGWLVDAPERSYQWPDEVVEAAFELASPGDSTPVIETRDAFYLLRLAAVDEGRVQPLEQVADGIRHRLARTRAVELEGQLFADIEQRYPLEIDETVFESIEAPTVLSETAHPEHKPPALPVDPAD